MTSFAATTLIPPSRTTDPGAPGVSALRLNLLRACYALMAFGLGATIWPDVIQHTDAVAARSGISFSLLAGLGATAALGMRYPLRMLPLLIFELVWKAIFLTAFALPLYLSHRLGAAMMENVGACLIAVIFVPVIPWRYCFANFIMKRSEQWT